jgi:hypothetical protein
MQYFVAVLGSQTDFDAMEGRNGGAPLWSEQDRPCSTS